VIVASWLSIEQVVDIIESLQRVGDYNSGENPWTKACQQ
jgi:hypothetical protein